MIERDKIIRLIRYKVGDTDEAKYSKYDIYNALNEALRYLNKSEALVNSDFLEKTRLYNEADFEMPRMFALEGVPLPDDYLTLVGITRPDGRKLKPTEVTNIPHPDEYKITNDRIYCGFPAFVIAYKKSLPEIDDDNDVIELPSFCMDAIVKLASMVLQQAENDVLMQAIDDATRSIIPRRRYIGAEIKMPFHC